MTEENIGFVFDRELVVDLRSFITEYAMVQRAVNNYEKANRAEEIRTEIDSQQIHNLYPPQ